MKYLKNSQNMATILLMLVCLLASGVVAFFSYMGAILIIAGIAILALSIYRIEVGISLLVIYTIFEPFVLKFIPDEYYLFMRYAGEGLLLILLASLIITKIAKSDFRYKKSPVDIPLALFIVASVVSMVMNIEGPYVWILGLRQVFRYAVLYYIIIYSNIKKDFIKKFLMLLIVLLIVQAAIGLAQAVIGAPADNFLLPGKERGFENIDVPSYVVQFWEAGQRVFTTMGRYDRLGVFMAIIMTMITAFLYQFKDKKIKNSLLVALLFSLPTFVLTYSRMSWLGLALAVVAIGAFIKKDKRMVVGLVAVVAAIALFSGAYMASEGIRIYQITDKADLTVAERILGMFSMSELKTSYRSYGRLYFIVNTPAKVVALNPFFGVGLGQYGGGVAQTLGNTDKYYEAGVPFGIEGIYGQIDNNWMSIWGEVGTIGLLIFIGLIYSLWRYAKKTYQKTKDNLTKSLALGFLGVVILVSFVSFLSPMFEIRTCAMFFWLFAGIVVYLGNQEQLFAKIRQ